MKNEQFYKIVIVLLLLLNCGVLGYLWLHKDGEREQGPQHPPRRPEAIIRERVGLDEQQMDAFEELKREHHMQMVDLQGEALELNRELFSLLKDEQIDTAHKLALITRLQSVDSMKEEVTFEHFYKLRALLRPEQQPQLDELVAELAGRVMGDPHRRRGPRHER